MNYIEYGAKIIYMISFILISVYMIISSKRKYKKNVDEMIELSHLKDKGVIDMKEPKLKGRYHLNKLNRHLANHDTDPDDVRHPQWRKQRQTFGFDERDTWDMNQTMLDLLYERLSFIVEFQSPRLSQTIYVINDVSKTQEQWIIHIRQLYEEYIETKNETLIDDIWLIWSIIGKTLN